MKVLSISTDIKIFDEMSAVKMRQMEYANKMDELHIVVFTLKSQNLSYNHPKMDNLYIYPTNSDSRFDYIGDAKKKAKEIVKIYNLNNENSVVTTQDPFETGLVGKYVKNKFGLPLQVQVHTDFLDPYFKNSILNRIRVILANFVIPYADGVRVVSSTITDSLKLKYPKLKATVDVLPIWVDVEKMKRLVDDFHPVELKGNSILMLSRFSKEKRIDLALNVFKKVLDTSKLDLRLKIIGGGPEKNNIISRVSNLSLGSKVEIIEWEKDPIRLYKYYDVFLLTSDFEGYGMTLVEAAASGCPIITTRVGLAKTDLFKDGVNSYVCPVGDIKCLSDKLRDLILNAGKAKEFASRMQNDIQKLNISKDDYNKKYIELLEQLLIKK